MAKKRCAFFLILCFLISGCGNGKSEVDNIKESSWFINMCFMESSLLYKNPTSSTNRIEFFDYKTKEYFPLCAKVNCLHETIDCTAVSLGRKADYIGRFGEKWYYHTTDDVEGGCFRVCDLNGDNEKKVGDFHHMVSSSWGSKALFVDGKCILATCDDKFDMETYESLGVDSGIYQFDLSSGTYEELCPEVNAKQPTYAVYGIYKNQLLYSEWDGEKRTFYVMDMDTEETNVPLGKESIILGQLSGSWFVCSAYGENGAKVIEFNMDTGEKNEIEAAGYPGDFYWSEDLKTYTVYDDTTGDLYFQMYQYNADGTSSVLRSGTAENYFLPYTLYGDVLIGKHEMDKGGLAYMQREDFLKGKNNWMILE